MQNISSVSSGQQQRALWLSTIAFTACFAVWMIFSIIGIQIKQQLGLSDTRFGLLIATPVLSGSLLRIFLGVWADQLGGRVVLTWVMLFGAIGTWLLTYATTYPEFLAAALFVGVAGGSFSVGVAYVSKWFPADKQGTALGIFGAGNIGAAVTKLLAPMVMVAAGWITVAKLWAVGLAVMAVLFYLLSQDDPSLAERRRAGVRAMPFSEQMAPLKNMQVWRFSLYYFFVFGGFVALALWLPRYLVGAYGMDVKTAGIIAAAYSIPASIFRIVGGWMSDRLGARAVMYWTFGASVICTFLLAYPDTRYVIKGIEGDIAFHLAIGVVPFTVLVFVLGFFMSLGKAAVYKHIPVYYPQHVGAVGGVVGMIGGLGGFVLPIAFGAMNDLTGVWTSCFMLLFVLVATALAWMHGAIRRMEHSRFPQIGRDTDLPEIMNAASSQPGSPKASRQPARVGPDHGAAAPGT
ncbi:MAG TPA: nitrate/nitrite transporter [Steroidobacter sp.]|uniref:MFS transporter n=1 Tax=Steroidobacter sp. TaxID=1978227 RepID=UPI002EDAB3B7